MKSSLTLLVVTLLAVFLVGCSTSSNNQSSSSAEPEKSADINAAIQEIFDREDVPAFVRDVTEESLIQTMNIGPELYTEMAGKFGNGRFNIEDALIIKPVDGKKDEIIDAINLHKKNRMDTFEHYNVGGDFEKAKNALVYEQGGYVILLLLTDNVPAKEIINKYIIT